jgi:hypothetical protein
MMARSGHNRTFGIAIYWRTRNSAATTFFDSLRRKHRITLELGKFNDHSKRQRYR